ncbi:MAG: hypothetical protein WBF93_03475, partial [Pirellulales bacterium]
MSESTVRKSDFENSGQQVSGQESSVVRAQASTTPASTTPASTTPGSTKPGSAPAGMAGGDESTSNEANSNEATSNEAASDQGGTTRPGPTSPLGDATVISNRPEPSDVPGTLARALESVARFGANIGGIETVLTTHEFNVRELTVIAPSAESVPDIRAALGAVEGVEVISQHDAVFQVHRGGKIEV